MTNEIIKIVKFMFDAFFHIWPYLVITIPIAVAVNMSGASRHIKRAFDAGPITAIFLATIVGAFSPFCSCGVIPVVATLLIGGVPLSPVMAFWIASPSMDPEIFFLSVGTIGWNLAVWRLIGTLILSLSAGFITHFIVKKQWIRNDILKHKNKSASQNIPSMAQSIWFSFSTRVKNLIFLKSEKIVPAAACCTGNANNFSRIQTTADFGYSPMSPTNRNNLGEESSNYGCDEKKNFWERLSKESLNATLLVFKFMSLAFFLEALIIHYIPEEYITTIMGQENPWAILTAAFLGVPVYTSNLSALPMVSGLLAQGMSPAAALAFLIAGPTTTLPAMAAVWTLVNYRVFILYVSFSLFGAIILGYLKLIFG
ncbi:permease [bacterium]|nr:permease [bacterium]